MSRWRQGRKVGRTLYLDDELVGVVDTPEIARQIVEAMNEACRVRDREARELEARKGEKAR